MSDDLAWNRLVTLHARVEHELTRALQRRHGLGLSEYRALARLSDGSSLRMQELAESINLNQSSVSRLITRLVAAGLTERDICADDRRGIYTSITPAGREVQSAAAPTYLEVLTSVLDRAAAEPELRGTVKSLRGQLVRPRKH